MRTAGGGRCHEAGSRQTSGEGKICRRYRSIPRWLPIPRIPEGDVLEANAIEVDGAATVQCP